MNIEYMTQVKENPVLEGFKNRSFSLDKIKQIEQKFNHGKEFPKAFREFLFLAGDFNNIAFDGIDGIEELQEYAKEDLEKTKQKVDKPFFAFHVYDGLYSVIFLDETNEDPKVYMIDPFEALEGSTLISIPKGGFKENYTFTELVNESIRRIKDNISF
ncbi:SMI1/KNR4 family protein [Chryseobacterium sp.]|uniref:SMI1/KNR4 family protein n=1 Tax=Chryseobacterium sp. TaxID=1871047 RepID=UPI0011C98B13|nr:SMI1/KNR4 family protein [Chryseobacterium sp.]TXF79491.1 SMI1/KNR4 family protein [Chryseobacterium sp.]